MRQLYPTRQEALFLLACALLLAWQLLLPGFIGIASNGDFSKVAGPLCIDDVDHSAYNFLFFQASYVRGPEYCFYPRVPVSELAIAWLASWLQKLVGDPARFDIRWLGGVHALLFLGFYSSILILLRPLSAVARFLLSLTALWMFADVGLIANLNSFYSDNAAILGGLTAGVLAVYLLNTSGPGWGIPLFGLAALLFITSKGQHGVFGFLPAGLAIAVAWRSPRKVVRIVGCVVAATLLAGTIWVLAETPDWYKGQARFNLIFFKIATNSRTPAEDLRELGLEERDLRYVGMHSFMTGTPMNDLSWNASFCNRSSYGRVLRFYVRHPDRALAVLWSDLRDEAPERRPVNLSNYQRSDGMPAGARTTRFGSWSALRTRLFEWWPAHILFGFTGVLVLSAWAVLHQKSRFVRSLALTLFTIALVAAAEFGMASLADACETGRHLLMFHLFTDLAIFLAVILVVASRQPQRSLSIDASN